MYEYFANLRKLPEPARRRKALLISLGVTLAIVVVWGIFLYIRIDNGTLMTKKEVSREASAPGIVETFSSFLSGVKGIFKTSETYENTAGTYDSK